MAVLERYLPLEIDPFFTSMIMGGRVVSCFVERSRTPMAFISSGQITFLADRRS